MGVTCPPAGSPHRAGVPRVPTPRRAGGSRSRSPQPQVTPRAITPRLRFLLTPITAPSPLSHSSAPAGHRLGAGGDQPTLQQRRRVRHDTASQSREPGSPPFPRPGWGQLGVRLAASPEQEASAAKPSASSHPAKPRRGQGRLQVMLMGKPSPDSALRQAAAPQTSGHTAMRRTGPPSVLGGGTGQTPAAVPGRPGWCPQPHRASGRTPGGSGAVPVLTPLCSQWWGWSQAAHCPAWSDRAEPASSCEGSQAKGQQQIVTPRSPKQQQQAQLLPTQHHPSHA